MMRFSGNSVSKCTIVAALLSCSLSVSAQPLEDPALVNQRTQEAVHAARAISPHTDESASAYYVDDAQAAAARAVERVWDPTQERPEPPRMPWGDPDLSGYWLNKHQIISLKLFLQTLKLGGEQ